MTISSAVRIAGPFTGDGINATFPFTYKVFSAADVQVIRLTILTGVETTLTIVTDYNITLNGNQNSNPGGSIVLTTPLLALYTLTATSNIANLQPTDLTNQGGFYPEVITDALDRATIQIQQMSDDVTRSIKSPLSDDLTTMDMTLPVVADRINKLLAFGATGMPTTVAQSPSSITGNTSIVGTLDVTGATTLQSTLGVAGTLGVTGATTLSSVGVTGAATVGTTLGVTGATTLASVGVTGAATVGTTLGVTGAATLSGGLSVPSGTTSLGPVTISGPTTIESVSVGKGVGTGLSNTVLGNNAFSTNSTGSSNTAIGSNALNANSTGQNNTAVGKTALFANSSASSNTAVGSNALTANTTGTDNTSVGASSLSANIVGNYNSAFGNTALQANTSNNNNAFGTYALLVNTTGSQNCAFGTSALDSNTTGSNNSAFGHNALGANTTGSTSTSVGSGALSLSTGVSNTAIGYLAGSTLTTGANVTCVGYGSQPATATTSNEITLGDINITSLRCQDTTITAVSDRRDKTNIVDIPTGLEFITAIRPVSFVWDMRGGGQVGTTAFGFIAQELLEAQTTIGITVPKLVSQNNPDRLEVGPAALLPIMVKAIQELNAKFEAYVATHP